MSNSFDGFRPRQELEQYTGVPNEVFDEIMSQIKGNEFKILMAIFRKTYGWVAGADDKGNAVYKVEDNIAQSQLMEMTGLSRNSVKNNLKKLITKGYIVKVEDFEKGVNKAAKYRIRQRGSKVDSRKNERVSKVDSPRVSEVDSRRGSKVDSTKERFKESKKDSNNNVRKQLSTEEEQQILDDLKQQKKARKKAKTTPSRIRQAMTDIWNQSEINLTHFMTLKEYADKLNNNGEGVDLVIEAMKEAKMQDNPIFYCVGRNPEEGKGILNRFVREDITSVSDLEKSKGGVSNGNRSNGTRIPKSNKSKNQPNKRKEPKYRAKRI